MHLGRSGPNDGKHDGNALACEAASAAATDGPFTWTVPLDGTTADLATTTVLAQGSTSSVWGTVADVALIVLIAWVVLAVGFIAFVAKARRDRARRRPTA